MLPLLVRVEELEGIVPPERFAFIKSPVRIGRGDLNDLPLPRPYVSTYHGLIQFDDAEASYVDLGSVNGSVLDGVQLEKNAPAPLRSGSELLIGFFRLTFERRTTSERHAVPRAMTAFAQRVSVIGPPPGPPSAAPEGPAPAPPTVPDDAARAAATAALEPAWLDLDLHYASYRGTWEYLWSAVDSALSGLAGPARRAALEQLASRYAAIVQEPQFARARADAAPHPPPARAAPAATPGPLGGDPVAAEALRLCRAFAESYLPETSGLDTVDQVAPLLSRVADILETFALSYLELRRGCEEFGREMGVRTVQAEGALHRARDPGELLVYLLDRRGEDRDRELQRAFADFMIHQLALLRGVEQGGQALLASLSPEAIAARAPQSVWPLKAASLWKTFEERFRELSEDDRGVADVLFGKEFARAYAAMVGRTSGRDDAEDGSPPGGAGRARGGCA